jgi:GDP-D-mannose dehydratase
MWRILRHGEGDDFVLATGEAHSVREFAEAAYSHVDLDWKEFVRHDPRYERPAEVDLLIGDPSKAKKILNGEPKVRFHELVRNPPSQAKTSRRVARFRAVKSTLFALSLTVGCLRSRPQVVPEELR